jgi:hypothetical protein
MKQITESFYAVRFTLAGEYVETVDFGCARDLAVQWAGRSSRLPSICDVCSTVTYGPVETWVAGNYFRNLELANAHAELIAARAA